MSFIPPLSLDQIESFYSPRKKDSPKQPDQIKKRNSDETKKKVSRKDSEGWEESSIKEKSSFQSSHPHLILEGGKAPIQSSFNFSPRANPENIDMIAKQIGDYLGDSSSTLLSQILAQISHNQYSFISPNSYILITSLEKANLLKSFLLNIARLTAPGSPLSQIYSKRLIEVGLRTISHPCAQRLIESKSIEKEIDYILFAGTYNLKNPKIQQLLLEAEETALLHKKKQNSPQDLAKEGLNYLSRLIREPEDKEIFEELQASSQKPPFENEKTFLFSVDFFVLKSNLLRLNQLQQESLIQICLNIFLSSKDRELLKIIKIKQISEQIMSVKLLEPFSPETQQLIQWTKIHLNRSPSSFKKNISSEELAKEGLDCLSRLIDSPQDQEMLKRIKIFYQNDPLVTQKVFLLSLRHFLLKKNRLSFDPLQQESLIELSLHVLTSSVREELLTTPKIKKIAKEILSLDLNTYKSSEIKKIMQEAKVQINSSFLSLKELQFLLFWIQSEKLPNTKDLLCLIAGLREWDPDGELYLFSLGQYLDLAKEMSSETDELNQLMHFILCWRKTPANQDLIAKPTFTVAWEKFMAGLNNLEESVKPIFISKNNSPALLDQHISLPNRDPGNPVFDLAKLAQPIPKQPHDMWNRETIIKDLRDSLVFHLLEASLPITVKDLSLYPKIEIKTILNQAKHFNQITQFLTAQLLASTSKEEICQIIKILCSLQNELLKYSAFEAAQAVHASIQQASVIRLKALFSKTDSFFDLFEDPSAVCFQQKNAAILRNLQLQATGALQASCLIHKDLDHLRLNSSPFTKEGKINIDQLQRFGEIFNNFTKRKQEALSFWRNTMQITPNSFILKILASQSGQITPELEDMWWDRSQKIHPEGSTTYWDIERANSGRK